MKTKKIPLRKCVACQEMMPKKQLIRIVKTPEDEVLIDLTGKKSGRGAYLCGKESCFKLALKKPSFGSGAERARSHRKFMSSWQLTLLR